MFCAIDGEGVRHDMQVVQPTLSMKCNSSDQHRHHAVCTAHNDHCGGTLAEVFVLAEVFDVSLATSWKTECLYCVEVVWAQLVMA